MRNCTTVSVFHCGPEDAIDSIQPKGNRPVREKPVNPIPAELTHGAKIETRPDGRVIVFAVEAGEPTGFFTTSNAGAGIIASQILNTARTSQESAKLPLPDATQTHSYPEVAPSMIALGPSRNKDSACLVMICGQAQIGFALETSVLRDLAHTLAALTASGTQQ
jgi:hypothetical protein